MKTLPVIIVLSLACSLAWAEMSHAFAEDEYLVASRSSDAKNERFSGTVELYVTSWCGYCRKALGYLKSKNIPYVAYDIEKDSAAMQRYKELGGRGVPLIIIGPHKMSGYSQEALEYYLENNR